MRFRTATYENTRSSAETPWVRRPSAKSRCQTDHLFQGVGWGHHHQAMCSQWGRGYVLQIVVFFLEDVAQAQNNVMQIRISIPVLLGSIQGIDCNCPSINHRITVLGFSCGLLLRFKKRDTRPTGAEELYLIHGPWLRLRFQSDATWFVIGKFAFSLKEGSSLIQTIFSSFCFWHKNKKQIQTPESKSFLVHFHRTEI